MAVYDVLKILRKESHQLAGIKKPAGKTRPVYSSDRLPKAVKTRAV
jgi:hypothetical protein